MHPREKRLAMNEVLFRKANDRIDDHSEDRAQPGETIDFYCECSDVNCVERLAITAHEFEHVRARPTQFLVRPGHEDPELETVVTRTPLYLVVEKVGEAAEFVKDALDEP